MRVLLVDDEVRLTDGIRRGLLAEGMTVDVAHDGVDGLWRAREFAYDVVLLDVMMPGKSGLDVCQALRADESFADVPILMLTAKGRDTDVAKGLALGADAYVTKPFSTRELVAKVRELLGPPP